MKLGKVTGVSGRGITIALAEELPDLVKPGDGLLFDLGKPAEQEPGGRVWEVRHLGPNIVEVRFAAGAVAGVPVGCEVWKTDDPALTKRLEQTYSQDRPHRRTPVAASVRGALGGPLTLTLTDIADRRSTATWPGPLEVARQRGTTPDEIRARSRASATHRSS